MDIFGSCRVIALVLVFANRWILPARARNRDTHSPIDFAFDDKFSTSMLGELIRLAGTGALARVCSGSKHDDVERFP